MEYPYSENIKQIADSMGIGLHQRFTLNEAALFLRCKVEQLRKLKRLEQINYLQIPGSEVEFFGHHLLEYLLASSTSHTIKTPPFGNEPDRILRTKEVQEITGLSRTSFPVPRFGAWKNGEKEGNRMKQLETKSATKPGV